MTTAFICTATPDWTQCQKFFEVDRGSLRDIYVFGISPSDCQKAYEYYLGRFETRFEVENELTTPPATVGEIFNLRLSHPVLLKIFNSGVQINTHFFNDWEIECDVSPADINSQATLNVLLEFMRQLGELTGKSVDLTEENIQEMVQIRYDVDSKKFQIFPDNVIKPVRRIVMQRRP